MNRWPMTLAIAALAIVLLAATAGAQIADYRKQCLERVKSLIVEPHPEGDPKLSDCVRADITAGLVDVQSMGFAVFSGSPGRNVQRLIDAGFPVRTGQGAMIIGTLNKLFVEGNISGETYLDASEPLVNAGALLLFGDGPLDVLSELLRRSPDPETVCGYAALVGGFDVFEDQEMPRSLAAINPAFGAAEREVLIACGL